MTELAKSVVYPDHFYYLLEFVGANPLALRLFYGRYPDLAGDWPDLSEYSADDLDEIDALLKMLRLNPIVSDHTKSVPDDDDAA